MERSGREDRPQRRRRAATDDQDCAERNVTVTINP
jgi:hypothetical protein